MRAIHSLDQDSLSDPESIAFTCDWPELSQAAAGAVGGYVASRLVPWGVDAMRRVISRCRAVDRSPQGQLRAIVDATHPTTCAGPFTPAGLTRRIGLLQQVQRAHPAHVSDKDLCLAIAGLAQAIPLRPVARSLKQIEQLTDAMVDLRAKGRMTFDDLRAAVEHLANALDVIGDAPRAKQIARALMSVYSTQLPPEDAEHTAQALFALRTPMLPNLRQAACFAQHPSVVTDAAASTLSCNETFYAQIAVQPAVSSRAPTSRLIERLKTIVWPPNSNSDAVLDDLFLHLCEQPDACYAAAGSGIDIRERLQSFPDESPAKARALWAWARLTSDASARALQPSWEGVSDEYRSALQQVVERAKALVGVQAVTPAAIEAHVLQRVPLAHLRTEVAHALTVANCASTPLERATLLNTIAADLSERDDLASGEFLEGLMAPEDVIGLIRAIQADHRSGSIPAAEAIARLPKLCQLRASQALLNAAADAVQRLACERRDLLHVASTKIDERIAPAHRPFASILGHRFSSPPAAAHAVHIRVQSAASAANSVRFHLAALDHKGK